MIAGRPVEHVQPSQIIIMTIISLIIIVIVIMIIILLIIMIIIEMIMIIITMTITIILELLQADRSNMYNRAKFLQNGKCGYVLKPIFMQGLRNINYVVVQLKHNNTKSMSPHFQTPPPIL